MCNYMSEHKEGYLEKMRPDERQEKPRDRKQPSGREQCTHKTLREQFEQ